MKIIHTFHLIDYLKTRLMVRYFRYVYRRHLPNPKTLKHQWGQDGNNVKIFCFNFSTAHISLLLLLYMEHFNIKIILIANFSEILLYSMSFPETRNIFQKY